MFTESQLKKLKPKNEPYQVSCNDGLSLFIEPSGKKYWKLRFNDANGKRKIKRLGLLSELSLRAAKNEKAKIIAALQNEIEQNSSITFYKVSKEWLDFKKKNSLGDKPLSGVLELAEKFIENELDKSLGKIDFRNIRRTDLVKLIRKIESRGVKEPCRKACSYLNQIYEYAISIGYIELNIASNLNKVLMKTKIKKNYAYLNDVDVIQFYNNIGKSNSYPIVRKALQIKSLTGVRGAELINAKKEHFDLEKRLWNIPAIQVKQFRRKVIEGHKIPDYVVPLSKQAVEIIESAMEWSIGSEYVFNSPKKSNNHLHFNTMNRAIRLMGYSKDSVTSHGLRSSMSTILNGSDLFKSEWIEAQLSHTDKNSIRGTYNHADYLKQRANMMQWWADYLESKTY
ncbi:integrase (plasmid) [Acinetobacter sp. TGL-Y2]|uniref:tyrosine-type recombinase/integrase n=1 Tax=Acinetobacter sp. TGL-Y2 TaxID=1407071 RepID=UPI0007A655FC|nr:tyrosine-type recombinase/integrase [Acinetobacter sp. TGL-Y2]AMW80736.1 integrase [Acinetobacter sp. TGL-Y2]